MYRTGRRKHILHLQKTTQLRRLLSCFSSTGWKARSRRTTNHLLKTSMKPGPRTQLLNWPHQHLLRYFLKQLNIVPTQNIPQEKFWNRTCIPGRNLTPKDVFHMLCKEWRRKCFSIPMCAHYFLLKFSKTMSDSSLCKRKINLQLKTIKNYCCFDRLIKLKLF